MKDERGCGGRTERVAVGRPTVANTRPLRAPLNPYCQEWMAAFFHLTHVISKPTIKALDKKKQPQGVLIEILVHIFWGAEEMSNAI